MQLINLKKTKKLTKQEVKEQTSNKQINKQLSKLISDRISLRNSNHPDKEIKLHNINLKIRYLTCLLKGSDISP